MPGTALSGHARARKGSGIVEADGPLTAFCLDRREVGNDTLRAAETKAAGGGSPIAEFRPEAASLLSVVVWYAYGRPDEGSLVLADAPSVFQPPFRSPTRLEADVRLLTLVEN